MVSVGVAASALEAAIELCKNKTPAYQGVPLKEQQLAQFLLGKAASRVEAARDTLFRAADIAYADAESSGKSLSVNRKSGYNSRCHSPRRRVPKLCDLLMTLSALRQSGSGNRLSGIFAI